MKKNTNMFITGLITGILASVLIILVLAPKMMFTVTESKYDFDKTAEMIIESTKTNKWSMPHHYDLQATMAKHGFSVKPVKVFSVCKPDVAVRVLGSDDDQHVSAMMPCRIAIFEKKDGKTYVSRLNAGLLSKILGGNIKAVMGDAGDDSEKILEPLFK
ncbi:DUF302 domain-containing protein [Sunxiuqinia sp. A32]|uniref:DUF302 domain-containing protein n=1 Tax=Sunxiuqinia sp. A32 TaxID=3461496 RepID=UPI004045EB12